MPSQYGDYVAKNVSQGAVPVVVGAWNLLSANGQGNLAGRRAIRLFVRGNKESTLALQYVEANSDGSFTAPTAADGDTRDVTIIPGGSLLTEPIGDNVQIYGRLLKKGGGGTDSMKVIATEYK